MATEQTPLEPDLREPRRRSREFNALLWLGGWGGAAAIALTALAIASQTKTAGDRLRQVFAINEPAAIAQMPPRVTQLESDVQLLTAQVRALTVERDRLAGRIALLESGIDDMTGAIKRQAAATAAALAAKTAPPAPSAPATTAPSAAANASSAAPTTPPPIAAPASKADTPTNAAVPLPPTRVAAVSANDPAPPATNQNEFGLDLGGAATLDGIRQRWITVKASFGPLLSGMYPLAAREHRAGASGYRLVVGPLPNSPAATGLCAHFAAARTACKSVKFDGEQIAEH
jgi:TolA-binding protein